MSSVTVINTQKKRRWSDTLKNFWLDIALFIAFVIDMNTHFTGIAIHEWLGIGIGIALFYHLMLHWKWIVGITKRIFGKLPAVERIRYIVDFLFFIDMVALTVTGLWISQVAMGQIGFTTERNMFFSLLHRFTADWAVYLIAIHMALSWNWIVSTFKRYMWQPLARKRKKAGGQA